MLLFTTAFIVATTLAPAAHGQYFPRPFQMAIQNGFSPYHPARINHETLPISQAEFAQLVAESMATSNGPHHHHPPNTDADYEGPDHARHDAEMLRSASGESHYGAYQSNHNHHYHPHQHHNHQHQHHNHHHNHQPQHQQYGHHSAHSEYQPDDHYHHENDESYHRSPVYEHQSRKHEQYPQQEQQEDEEDDEADEGEGPVEQYGGRPSNDYQPTSGYDSQRYMNNYEEEAPNSRDQYMAASEHIPIKIIPLKHH